jgi:transcriptional regulator with XRE-family HTH domain
MLQTNLMGERIANARIARGLSEKQLANRLGVNASSIEDWEAGQHDPRANRINQLAGILEVPLTWLIAGEQLPPTVDTPDFKETQAIEHKLEQADKLVNQLSFLLTDIRSRARQVQRNIDLE